MCLGESSLPLRPLMESSVTVGGPPVTGAKVGVAPEDACT